jgi:hypothetical protein
MKLLHIETGGREHPLYFLSSLHHAGKNHIKQDTNSNLQIQNPRKSCQHYVLKEIVEKHGT